MDKNLIRFDKTSKLGFIDFETYNLCLSFIGNKPWQAGLMSVIGDDAVKSDDILINWKNPPTFDAGMVSRLFKCSVAELNHRIETKGVTPEEAFLKIYDFLGESDYIIGHNIMGFDVYLIKEFCRMMGKPWKHFMSKFIDTNCLAKGVKLNIPFKRSDSLLEYHYRMYHKIEKGVRTRLELLGKEFGVEHDYEKLHDALVDLDLNRKIWNNLKWKVEI